MVHVRGAVCALVFAAGAIAASACKKDDKPTPQPTQGTGSAQDAAGPTAGSAAAAFPITGRPVRILVVSSYHREYLWSQDTNKGVVAALVELGYFRDDNDGKTFTDTDNVETPKAVVKKLWMDTKRRSDREGIAKATAEVMEAAKAFKPDIVMLGDDNAANYVGNQFLDTATPVVFWGINGLPLKYGLIDTLDKPGHNVTGIYQAGYLKDCVEFLQKIVPAVKTMAALSDDSETGRAKVKELEHLAEQGKLPVKLVGSVITNSEDEWKKGALELAKKADAIFVMNHNTVKDKSGNSIDQMVLGAWYLQNVKKPDCGHEKQFAEEGLLATADDSGYNQGYEATKLAHQILQGTRAGDLAVKAPARGPLILNRQRAQMLGIKVTDAMGVEQFIDQALALKGVK